MTFTANGRNDLHVTLFVLNLPLAVLSFSLKLSSFVFNLATGAKIILHYSLLFYALFFSRNHKRESHVCRLP